MVGALLAEAQLFYSRCFFCSIQGLMYGSVLLAGRPWAFI